PPHPPASVVVERLEAAEVFTTELLELPHVLRLPPVRQGGGHARVDGKVHQRESFRESQLVPIDAVPILFAVDGLGLLDREVLDVDVGVSSLGDAVLGLASRVTRVVDVPALPREDEVNDSIEF